MTPHLNGVHVASARDLLLIDMGSLFAAPAPLEHDGCGTVRKALDTKRRYILGHCRGWAGVLLILR